MSKSRIAPVRPSIAKILKRQIGGFVREYEREVNRPATSPAVPVKKPPDAESIAKPVPPSVAQPAVQPDPEKAVQTPPKLQPPEPTE